MLALSTGTHINIMDNMKAATTNQITKSLSTLGISNMENLYSSSETAGVSTDTSHVYDSRDPEGRTGEVYPAADLVDETTNFSSRKTEQLLYQLPCEDSEAALLEQRITFLGCSMECLRSSLAVWVQKNPRALESIWSPELREDAEKNRQDQFAFRASDSFSRCLGKQNWCIRANDRHVQMRLLWELQNYFQSVIPEEGLSPERHEAIILCLLSFPAIEFVVGEDRIDCGLTVDNTADGVNIAYQHTKQAAHISLCVPLAPQEFGVAVRQELTGKGEIKVSVLLSGEGRFYWELWRNDFLLVLKNRGNGKRATAWSCLLWFEPTEASRVELHPQK